MKKTFTKFFLMAALAVMGTNAQASETLTFTHSSGTVTIPTMPAGASCTKSGDNFENLVLSYYGYDTANKSFTYTFSNFKYQVNSISVSWLRQNLRSPKGTFVTTPVSGNAVNTGSIEPGNATISGYGSTTIASSTLTGLNTLVYTQNSSNNICFNPSGFLTITYEKPVISFMSATKTIKEAATLTNEDLNWSYQGAFDFSDITFSSSNTNVVKVDGTTITPVSNGTATITATLKNNGETVTTATINVTAEVSVTANMQITEAGCATFCAPFDVVIPEGVKAYTADKVVDDSWISMTEVTGTITAGTPVVLYGNAYTNEFKAVPTYTESTTPTTGCLTGNLGTLAEAVTTGNYLLQNQAQGLGWYEVKESGRYIGVNRCYMTKTAAPGAKAFYGMSFDGEAPTAINSVIANEAQTKADGKYLVNGKIVIVKAGKAYSANGAQMK